MPYPAFAREIAQRAVPGLMADRARRYERDVRERQGVTRMARDLIGDGRITVMAGPFEGMNYPADRIADVDAPVAKLLGTYEQEIRSTFTDALGRVRTFIDVGCADGYFAVGMPYVDRDITSYAFDLSRSARELCWEVARTNVLEGNVRISKRFKAASLDSIDPVGALMLCDIEGGEAKLFDPALVRRLAQTTVVIEVHEHTIPGVSRQLQARFAPSHEVQVVSQQARPPSPDLPPEAFEENRPPELHWLVCKPSSR